MYVASQQLGRTHYHNLVYFLHIVATVHKMAEKNIKSINANNFLL